MNKRLLLLPFLALCLLILPRPAAAGQCLCSGQFTTIEAKMSTAEFDALCQSSLKNACGKCGGGTAECSTTVSSDKSCSEYSQEEISELLGMPSGSFSKVEFQGGSCSGSDDKKDKPTPSGTSAPTPAKPKPVIKTTSLASFPNPLGNVSVPGLVNRIISGVLGLVGALFFVMFLYGGVTYMTAGGEAAVVKKATTTLTNALIGIAIVAISYVIVNFIIDALAKGISK